MFNNFTFILVLILFVSIVIPLLRVSFGEHDTDGDGLGPALVKTLKEISTWMLAASVLFGIVLVTIGYIEIVQDINMPARQYQVIRMIIAFGAGFISAGVIGSISIEGELGPLIVKAGGPFAAVVLFYLVNP